MNREILFRGKNEDNGKWVEGSLFYDPDLEQSQIMSFEYESSDGGLERGSVWSVVIPETVGQYTGLTDKNGRKIFEGDIVKVINCDYIDIEVVKWSENGAGFVAEIYGCYVEFNRTVAKECEVIGNIYDNADLLKENEI